MRKFAIVTVAILAVALVGGQSAYANYCSRDVVPAATLLVPYASVGMTQLGSTLVPDPAKPTTLFSMTNVSATAQVVHVTVWDVLSVPQLDFDVILSGYDTWQINFRDMLAGDFTKFDTSRTTLWPGTTPIRPFEWGPNGQDARDTSLYPGDATGDTLVAPQDRTAITTCGSTTPPYGDLTGLSGLIINKFAAPLFAYTHDGCDGDDVRTDQTSWLTSLTDNPVFFYVTADVVDGCNQQFPNSSGYWENYGTNNNVLIGDIIYFDPSNGYSEMFNAVAIEADSRQTSYDEETFYDTGNDYREPLGTAFGFRYASQPSTGMFSSTAIVWKNVSEVDEVHGLINDCGRYLYYAFDDNEHSLSRQAQNSASGLEATDIDMNQFPFETQKVDINSDQFDVYDTLDVANNHVGWMMLVFPPSYGAGNPYADDFVDNMSTQAWVGMTFQYNVNGLKFSAGTEAALLGNYHCNPTEVIPQLNTYTGIAE